jgi:hypothetical protein
MPDGKSQALISEDPVRRELSYLAAAAAGLAWGCADTPTVAPRTAVRDALVPTAQPSFSIGGGGPTGAIFTTVPDGSIVNENVRYRDKREVYLDGGPRGGSPQTAAGLDDGDYVFQITDPSGKFLLSQDKSECRLMRVRDGVIVTLLDRDPTTKALTPHSASDACHTNDAPTPPATAQKTDFGATGKHDTNVDVDFGAAPANAIVIQMMPYANTPNPGGVYKAWISKIDEYAAKATGKGVSDPFTEPLKRVNGRDAQPCSQGCYQADPGFGPPRNFQKTDNFKVLEEARLRVVKVNDLDGDGVRDGNEPTLEGWDVAFIEPLGDGTNSVIRDQTTATRTYVPGAQITVCEAARLNWKFSFATGGSATATPAELTGTWYCVLATVGASGSTTEIAFGNFQYGEKNGYKFHDRNINGVWDKATEEGLSGWTINLTGTDGKNNPVSRTTTTGTGGYYEFKELAPGSYTVAEVCPTGWYQSYPTPSGGCGTGVHAFTIVSGAPGAPDVHANNNFGNYQPSTKTGVKYHDLNGNGTRDANEPGIAGVTIALLSGGSLVQSTTTDANGNYTLSGILPSQTPYLVCEVLPAGYTQSAPNANTTLGAGEKLAACPAGYAAQGYEITVSASAQSFTGNDFGNYQNGSVSGTKISDANGSGTVDAGEVGLANWPIHLFGTTGLGAAVHRHELTNGSGQFTFANLPPGQYKLCEEQKPGFLQKFPTLATAGAIDCGTLLLAVHDPVIPGIGYDLTLQSGQNLATGFDFLNQPNQGCTPGFWQGGFGIDLWNTANDPEWGLPRITNGSTNPFTQATLFNSFFQPAFELAGLTMLDIVGTGGTEVEARKAARSLIAGYLNTTALSAYPFSQGQLVSLWNAANNNGAGGATRLANLLTLHTQLDAANNLHNTVLCQ